MRREAVPRRVAAVLLALGLVFSLPRTAEARQGEHGEAIGEVGGSYLTGDYGTDRSTDVWQGSIRLGWAKGPFEASLTIPALHVRTVGTATSTGGGFAPVDDDSDGFFDPGEADDEASGPGDLLLEARMRVLRQGEQWEGPSLEVVAQIKAPTADEGEGLGTGEWDGGAGVAGTWTEERVTLRGDLRFIAIGEPDGLDLAPVVVTWLGSVSYRIPEERASISPFGYLSGSSPVSEDGDPPVELGAGVAVADPDPERLAPRVTLTLGVGLTDGSPDFRAALAIAFRFGLGEMPEEEPTR